VLPRHFHQDEEYAAVKRPTISSGADDWTINSMIELFGITRTGYLSKISPAVEQVTGNKPTTFSQFARDYASAFK
jgi:hypothetical protein